ncbi:MAG: hypothetical protein K6F05_01060 [Succinivibrio sp.]|nr:hypothetical protein [Succinivibrio sp.]
MAEDSITPQQAASFVGQQKTVCGTVSQIVTRKDTVFINFGGKYPKQIFHLYLTQNLDHNFSQYQGKTLCAQGKIELYKNKPEITNPKLLKAVDKF